MKYVPLIWAGLWRRPWRTIFALISIATAFLLLGMLSGVDRSLERIVSDAHPDRLYVLSRVGREPLPFAYRDQIARVHGVQQVTYLATLVGRYRALEEITPIIAVEPAGFFSVFPEYRMTSGSLSSFRGNRTAAIVGSWLVRRFHWRIGDTITLQTNVVQRDGRRDWSFHIAGIFDTDGDDTLQSFTHCVLINYDYYDAARFTNRGTVTGFFVTVANPQTIAQTASDIDRLFVNSQHETKSQSEREFAQSLLQQIGDIGFVIDLVVGAVFATLLLLTGTTMAQSVRERTRDIAVFKTIGFPGDTILYLIIAEALVLCLSAAALGLVLAFFLFGMLASSAGFVEQLPLPTIGLGLIIASILALLTAAVPAGQAMRLRIVNALAKSS